MIASILRYFDGTRYALGAFAVMPNHVHALVHPLGGAPLTQIVHAWKSYSAHELQRHAGIERRVWQEESFDRIVRDQAELVKFNDYILANPAEANLQPGTYIVGQGSANWLGHAP
jgi:REP element-mobilizing transposase RayT